MLSLICTKTARDQIPNLLPVDDRFNRNEQEDLKIAIDYIYEFKAKLERLNPAVMYLVEKILSSR